MFTYPQCLTLTLMIVVFHQIYLANSMENGIRGLHINMCNCSRVVGGKVRSFITYNTVTRKHQLVTLHVYIKLSKVKGYLEVNKYQTQR